MELDPYIGSFLENPISEGKGMVPLHTFRFHIRYVGYVLRLECQGNNSHNENARGKKTAFCLSFCEYLCP